MTGSGNIKILPPLPGHCKICAAKHDPAQPHDRDSLIYQNRFYKKHRRFPTWEDAMSHCDEETKAIFRAKLSPAVKETEEKA